MVEKDEETTESTGAEESTEDTGGPKAKARRGAKSKRNVEEKLDDIAERFSKVMTDGVRRMEEAFDRGLKNVEADPTFGERTTRVKHFFKSSTGGAVLIIVGIVWFFYATGLLDMWIFPLLVIVIGFYLMQRYRSQ